MKKEGKEQMTTEVNEPVNVKVHQAYNLKVNVNIVSARNIPDITKSLRCQPRQGAPRRKAEALDLPDGTISKLFEANKDVMNWLASDQANLSAFLADPVAAIQKAGVKLERSEIKGITRLRMENGMAEVVTPGLKLNSMSVTVNPHRTVRRVERTKEGCCRNDQRKEK